MDTDQTRKGDYALLDDEDLDSVCVDSRKTNELVQFVDAGEIAPLYYEKPFYVVPDGDLAEGGFVMIREALHRAQKQARLSLVRQVLRDEPLR